MNDLKKLKIHEAAKIMKNPVLWAKAFLRTVDNKTKKIVPWTARWYQAEMLLDPSDKKVARCGRRTGKTGRSFCPFPVNCRETGKSRQSAAKPQHEERSETGHRNFYGGRLNIRIQKQN